MDDNAWYYLEADQQKGPVSEATLRELLTKSIISAYTLVWCDGMADWRPASEVLDYNGSPNVAPVTIPPVDSGESTESMSMPDPGSVAAADVDFFNGEDKERRSTLAVTVVVGIVILSIVIYGIVALWTPAFTENQISLKVDLGATGQTVKEDFIEWSVDAAPAILPPRGNSLVSNKWHSATLKNIAGTGVSAKLETGHKDDMGWRSREGGDIGRDFLHPNDYGGAEYGRIILTLSHLPSGSYRLTSFHNKVEDPPYTYRGIPISKVNIAISGAVSAAEGAIGIIQTEIYEHTDAGIGTGVVTFTATGKGDVVIEFAPDGSATDEPRNLGDRVWLNGFVLEQPGRIRTSEKSEKKPILKETTSSMASRPRGIDPGLLKLPGTKQLVNSGWKGSWSPDGSRLVFARPTGEGLQLLELESGRITDLTSSGRGPAWSPDGQLIAYVENVHLSEEVWLVKPIGAKHWKLADGGFPSWSADGKTVLVQSRKENKIFAIDVNNPGAEPKVFYDGHHSWYPSISPDGQRIAFGSEGSLVVVDRETGKTILEWPTPGSCGLLVAWSPDGNRIAFGGYNHDPLGLWVLDLKTGEALQIAEGPYTMPAWSKDGTRLAFDQRWRNIREIWVVESKSLDTLEPSQPTMREPSKKNSETSNARDLRR